MPKSILIVASLDTKWPEVKFLKELIEQRGQSTVLLDMSMRGKPPILADIPCDAVARAGGSSIEEIRTSDKPRDESTSIMIRGAIAKALEMYKAGKLAGIIGVGGVSNTAMATDVMKALPFGMPKLMVSSGAAMPSYAGGFFGSSDIAIISSVVDMAGLHELSKSVLKRAAGAICGMVESGADSAVDLLKQAAGRLIAMTEFQYSGLCCELVKQHIEGKGCTVIPCHADGVGDRAMENLLEQGIFDAVLDIVPAGLSEELFGGNRAAGTERLEMAGKRGIPQIVAPCGVNLGSPLKREYKPDYKLRKKYDYDAVRTFIRLSKEEMMMVANAVADKLNQALGPVKVLIPLGGWSSIDRRGTDFYDAELDRSFVDELKKQLKPSIEVREVDTDLNTPEFADAIIAAFSEIMERFLAQ